VETKKSGLRNFLVHFLPALHLCACLIIELTQSQTGLDYLFFIDLPVSAFIFAISYGFNHPLILYGVLGSFWWYLLSRAAEIIGTRVLSVFKKP
jgi:hypothetical protein